MLSATDLPTAWEASPQVGRFQTILEPEKLDAPRGVCHDAPGSISRSPPHSLLCLGVDRICFILP
jgi:hypothetical protein